MRLAPALKAVEAAEGQAKAVEAAEGQAEAIEAVGGAPGKDK